MADNKNIELNDEMMAKVTGGSFEPITPYSIGTRVFVKGNAGEAYGEIADVHIRNEFMALYDVQIENGGSLVRGIPHEFIILA
ncbi:hypothetical protein SAMN05216349_1614 [Oribacterium sp. KHPX15]|uniref:hypothetical protein n=1 Tax=Oribacterium sp. KHPX15 TaxID=1855342 RepID=UPI000899D7BA|nr:hypothetical protein [Oribacterium sp. KHPX15]SEA94145.1 hypothetical protein SAMN05216349_1614 [Oribacterium sp. KHPX15]